jgi:hypothetical protein
MLVCRFGLNSAHAQMIADYEISLGTPNDIPGILTLQELNLIERGGGLSVRQTADWFRHAIFEKSLVVGVGTAKSSVMCWGLRSPRKHMWQLSRPCCALSRPRPIATFMALFV